MFEIDYLFWDYCCDNDLEADLLIKRYGLINVFRDWCLNGCFTLPVLTDEEIALLPRYDD